MKRLLLVEDNEMNRDMLRRRLLRRDYDVLVAADGEQAVRMALAEVPDLIVMDLSLPVVDGWTATRRLRMEVRTRNVPVIALTAHALPADRELALESGCDDYDTKPVDFERLLEKIEGLLREGRPNSPEAVSELGLKPRPV